MAKAEAPVSWETLGAGLRRWHDSGDRDALRAALVFLEPQLWLMVPGVVKRTWPGDLVEDAIHAFLTRLIEVPLPPGIDNLPGYLSRAFRNHCIDQYEARRRRKESSVEGGPGGWEPSTQHDESPAEVALRRERAERLHLVLQQLEIADRVVLKLEHAPEWLDSEEMGWLAGRLALDEAKVWEGILAAEDMHALTRIFDPGDDDPEDPALRRKRMERFRRRRARAREKLRALLVEVG